MTKKQPSSKAMKVWPTSESYIKEVQQRHKLKTPQAAIDLICMGHSKVDRNPTQRAQGKIQEASGILEGESARLFLGLVCRVLSDEERALDLAKEALLKIIEALVAEDNERAAKHVQETLDDGEK